MINSITSLAISLLGNFYLAGIFLNVLLHRVEKINFITNDGFFIIFIEFLSIGYILLLTRFGVGPNRQKIFVFLFFLIFVFGLYFLSGDIFLILFFFISLVTKLFGKNAVSGTDILHLSILILVLFIAGITSGMIDHFFALPEGLLVQNGNSMSPQSLIFGGFLYFFFIGVAEIILFFKKRKVIVIHN